MSSECIVNVVVFWRMHCCFLQAQQDMAERMIRLRMTGIPGPISPAVSLAAAKIAVDKEYFKQILPYKMPQIPFEAAQRQSKSIVLGPSIGLHPFVARKQVLPSDVQDSPAAASTGQRRALWDPEERQLAMDSISRKKAPRSW